MRRTGFTALQIVALLSTLVFLMAFSIQRTTFVQASPGTVVRVEPSPSYSDIGETFTINITVVDVQNLYGIEVTLYWNASVLYAVSVDTRLGVESHPDGVLHEIPETTLISYYKNETLQEQGKYFLAASSSAPADSFNGSGNIIKTTFKVINEGSSELNLETKLASKPPPGGVSSPIEHTTIDGFFGPHTEEQPIWPIVTLVVVIIVAVIVAMVIYSKRSKKR